MESKCPDETAPRAVQDDVTMHILRMLGHFFAGRDSYGNIAIA